MLDNRAMALRWLAKISETNPVGQRTLEEAADYIDELEVRQVLFEAIIERLIEDGDHAIYMRGMKYNKSWREIKKLVEDMVPDVEQALVLTSGMRVYVDFLAREYDDDPKPGEPIPMEGGRFYSKTDPWPMGDTVCRYPGESRRPAPGENRFAVTGAVSGRMSSTEPNISEPPKSKNDT